MLQKKVVSWINQWNVVVHKYSRCTRFHTLTYNRELKLFIAQNFSTLPLTFHFTDRVKIKNKSIFSKTKIHLGNHNLFLRKFYLLSSYRGTFVPKIAFHSKV